MSMVCFFVIFLVLKQIPDPFFNNLSPGFSAAEEQFFVSPFSVSQYAQPSCSI